MPPEENDLERESEYLKKEREDDPMAIQKEAMELLRESTKRLRDRDTEPSPFETMTLSPVPPYQLQREVAMLRAMALRIFMTKNCSIEEALAAAQKLVGLINTSDLGKKLSLEQKRYDQELEEWKKKNKIRGFNALQPPHGAAFGPGEYSVEIP